MIHKRMCLKIFRTQRGARVIPSKTRSVFLPLGSAAVAVVTAAIPTRLQQAWQEIWGEPLLYPPAKVKIGPLQSPVGERPRTGQGHRGTASTAGGHGAQPRNPVAKGREAQPGWRGHLAAAPGQETRGVRPPCMPWSHETRPPSVTELVAQSGLTEDHLKNHQTSSKSGPVDEPSHPRLPSTAQDSPVVGSKSFALPDDGCHPMILWPIATSSRCAWPYR